MERARQNRPLAPQLPRVPRDGRQRRIGDRRWPGFKFDYQFAPASRNKTEAKEHPEARIEDVIDGAELRFGGPQLALKRE